SLRPKFFGSQPSLDTIARRNGLGKVLATLRETMGVGSAVKRALIFRGNIFELDLHCATDLTF
ncbi:MAG TPA: hypothetical protein VNV43_12575, partial [Candidatus Acidoferrales bacterium]|nr:hypothetical protein [Candidatus Acidoferrales bacterium]